MYVSSSSSAHVFLFSNCFLQVNGEFAVELFGELVRAYLAATNTRSQVLCLNCTLMFHYC